jgi:hypothetical protein
MTTLPPRQDIEIFVLRCSGDVVLRATTNTWKSFRRFLERLSVGAGDMVLSLQDVGAKGKTAVPPLTTLVVRCSDGPLQQSLLQSALVITGTYENLLVLAENIDCKNPIEGAHFHSDEWTPGVSPGSISLVFEHASNPHAL